MKRLAALIVYSLITALAISAQQPKVAVLDAQVPKGMDSAIVIPVTEKIIERLVVSGRYTVLDRANIEQVFKEREFQLTDIVSDQDAVAAAGKYLGADFVVVVKIQQVGDTYFLSAKMISIATGVISNQTSVEGEGKLSSLIGLAGKVGDVLANTTVVAAGESKSAAAAPKPVAQPKPAPAPKQAKQPKADVPASPSALGLGWLSVGVTGSYSTITTDMSRTLTSIPAMLIDGPQTLSDTNNYIGLSLWADVTYAEISIGYGRLLGGKYTSSGDWYSFWPTMPGSDPKPGANGKNSYEESFLSIVALAKYPFRFGSLSLFPLVGIEYDMNISYTGIHGATQPWSAMIGYQAEAAGEKAAQNRLFILGGIGIDYDLSGPLFIRAQGLYGHKLESNGDKERIDGWPELPAMKIFSNGKISAWKIDANICVGYRL